MSFKLLNQSNVPFLFPFSAFTPTIHSSVLFFFLFFSYHVKLDCGFPHNQSQQNTPCAHSIHPLSAQKKNNKPKSGTWEPTAMWHASALWCRCRAVARTTKRTRAAILPPTSSSFKTMQSSKRFGIQLRSSTAAGQIALPRRSAFDR